MKRLLFIPILLICGVCHAQCIITPTDVKQNNHGAIIVVADYDLNGQNVYNNKEIVVIIGADNTETKANLADAAKDICRDIIKDISDNKTFVYEAKKTRTAEVSDPIITAIETQVVGNTFTVNGVQETFKGKIITVTYDGSNSVVDE